MSHYANRSFGRRLKMLRVESGKSQERLARDLGISRSCLANYETGNREPDNDMLIKIADFFHVLVDFLMNRTDCRSLPFSEAEISSLAKMRRIVSRRRLLLRLDKLPAEDRELLRRFHAHLAALAAREAAAARESRA